MSILILIILIVLFFLFVFWGLIKATPTDYYYERGKYLLEHPEEQNILKNPRKPKESLYTPFTDFPQRIHTEEEQLSRMRRSTDTWIYLFPSTFTGHSAKIFGNSREIYNTSFSACSCMDFQKRKLPCKHMYYLAFFSGRMNDFDWIGDDEYYIINRFKLSNRPVAKKIYSLPPEEVLILRHIVRSEYKGEPELYVDISKVTNLLKFGLLAKTGKKNKTRILLFSLKVVEIKRFMRSNGYIFKDMSRNGLLSSIVNSDFDYKNAKGYIVYISVSLGNGIKGEEIERYLPEQWDGLKEGKEGYPFIPASSGWRNDILEEIVNGD